MHQLTLCPAFNAGFAGADYDLQDALTESTDKKSKTREVDGQTFYDYELSGPVTPLSSPCNTCLIDSCKTKVEVALPVPYTRG